MALTNDAWKGLAHLAPNADSRIDYRLEAIAGQPPVLAHWNETKLGLRPTEQQIADAIAAYDAAKATRETAESNLRQQVRTIAASAVGVAFKDLTSAQRSALLMVFAFKMGALDANAVVQPLDTWV